MKRITISQIQTLSKALATKGVVILAFGDDKKFQLVSYGRTQGDSRLLGKWLDHIYTLIEDGEILDPFGGPLPEETYEEV